MKIFKGNRYTTPRFNYPVFKFEKSYGTIIGRNKLPKAWFSPYNRAFSLFEHSMKVRRGKIIDVCFRGFWHDGVPYPTTATVSTYNEFHDRCENPELYVLDLPLPPYFATDYTFMNPLEIHGDKVTAIRFEPRFTSWFKERILYTKLHRSMIEKEHEEIILEALKNLTAMQVEEELMGVTLFENTRAQWLGKLVFPMWAAPDKVDDYLGVIKEELRMGDLVC